MAAVEASLEAMRAAVVPEIRLDFERVMAAVRAGLREDAFAAAWAAGRELTLEQAITEALADDTDLGSASAQ